MEFAEGSTFVGRSTELAQLTALAERTRRRQPAIVVITGDAGIGKSRLMTEWVVTLERDGAVVLSGACPPVAGVDLPLAPVIQALRSLRRRLGAEEEAAVLGPSRPVLARLAPSLGDPQSMESGPLSLSLLFEHLLGVLERLGDHHPLVVLAIDDLQWGGPTTWDLLAHLANNLVDVPVLVVATLREGAVQRSREAEILAELKRRRGVDVLDIEPLGAEEAHELAASVAPAIDENATRTVVTAANGNPLMLRELAAAAAAGRAGVPDTIREMLLARLSTLPGPVVHVLRTASVIGRRADAELLIAAGGPEEAVTLEALREAVRSGFLVRPRGDDTAFEFGQDVARQVVYEDLIPGERARIHGAVARALARSRETIRDVDRAVELAAHWQAAGDAIRAVPALLLAADAAERAYAFVEANRLYSAAFTLLDGAEPVPERRPIGFQPASASRLSEWADVRARAAEAASLAGESDRAIEHIDAAIEGSREGEDPQRRWRARRARYLVEAGRSEESLVEYERLVSARDADEGELSRTLVAYARALAAAGRHREAAAAGGRALERARATGQHTEEWQALTLIGTARANEGDLTAALAMLTEARRLSSERPTATMLHPRPTRIGELLAGRLEAVRALDHAGRPADAAALAADVGADADRLGAARWLAERELAAARQAYLRGAWDECRQRCDAVLTDAADPVVGEGRIIRARLSAGQGDWDSAEADLAAAEPFVLVERRSDVMAAYHLAAAEVAVWQRRLHEAAEILDRGLERLAAAEDRLARAELGAWALRVAAERYQDSQIRRGSPETSVHEEAIRRLLAETRALIDGLDSPRSRAIGNVAVAEAARTGGDAVGPWQAVVAATDAIPDPYTAAYGRWRLAEAMLSAGAARRDAGTELLRAHATAQRLGAGPLVRELERLAGRARVDLEAEAPTEPVQTSRPDLGLSERELEVLALVASGRTNRQIADELFITEKTAGHHVSNILAKLDVTNRLEAAAIAHRAGLTPE